MAEQQKNDKVTTAQNNGIKMYEQKMLAIARRETGPSETEVNVSQLLEVIILLMKWL